MQNERTEADRMAEFEAVALPHMKDLFRTAVALLRNRTEAEDVVQELYLQAWKSFHRFTPGTNCRAWLFQILFHVVSHHRRKWFRWTAVSEDLETVENTLAAEPPVVQEQLSDEEIIAALRRLPQQFAEVVILAEVHDFSYREIQETLGIPAGTVMSRLNRGRRLLRAQLTEAAAAAGIRSASQAA